MTSAGSIIVVDDTHASLQLLTSILAAEGYQVRPADSGELALASVAAKPPELILLDIRMPGMDGFEVFRRLRARDESREVPVIFLSAAAEVEQRIEGLRLGAEDFITKPFHRDELLARVRVHLEIFRVRARLARQAAELRQANERLQAEIAEGARAEAEIRRLNEELDLRVVELEAANKDLEGFSYSISHDLRAPLRAISGFATILARRYRDGLDETGRHYVDTIVDSSDHMGVLIEELLDYSRMGRRSIRAERVPLGPLVTRLRATFGDRIAATGATLEVVEPLATPVADPTLLERILSNLVDNALTYHRSDVAARVTLSATRRGRTVALAVADNGIGIPPEYRERIFEVFVRLHTDEEYPGTGIGLSIVRKAAGLMGSDVTVESTEGVGSTFNLELPAAQKRSTPS